MEFFREGTAAWVRCETLPNKQFTCGFCNIKVSSIKGYKLGYQSDGSGISWAAPIFVRIVAARRSLLQAGSSIHDRHLAIRLITFLLNWRRYMRKLAELLTKGVLLDQFYYAEKCS